MSTKNMNFKNEAAMQTFLDEMEWTDDTIEYDCEKRIVYVNTLININSNTHQLVVESSDNDIIEVYVYLRYLSVKRSKDNQMHILLSKINSRLRVGAFQFIREADWQYIRWHHATDFEGSKPIGTTIRHQVITGLQTVEDHADPIAAVALTNQTADQALQEFQQSLKNEGECIH